MTVIDEFVDIVRSTEHIYLSVSAVERYMNYYNIVDRVEYANSDFRILAPRSLSYCIILRYNDHIAVYADSKRIYYRDIQHVDAEIQNQLDDMLIAEVSTSAMSEIIQRTDEIIELSIISSVRRGEANDC